MLRFESNAIIFDDDITEGNDWTEITGYLWATNVLCDIAGYKGVGGTDDYINLYPTYNVETDEFYVIASMVDGEVDREIKLELTSDETDFIYNRFVEHYWGTKENFNDFCTTWTNELNKVTKSNFQMLREFDFKPRRFGILDKDEVETIRNHFQIAARNDIELQNLRDFVVMYYSVKQKDDYNTDLMSGIVGVIDSEKIRRGMEV